MWFDTVDGLSENKFAIAVKVFWDVILCRWVSGSRNFKEILLDCLILKAEGAKFLRYVGKYLQKQHREMVKFSKKK
jgi:hypothetical protein